MEQHVEARIPEPVHDTPEEVARPKPDREGDPAGEVGWYLEQERLRRGMDLEAASDATGIHRYHIFAIEHGDMTNMPSRIEALELVGNYANFLGFDPEPLLQHYVTLLPAPQLAPKHHPADPAPLSSAKIMKFGRMTPKLKPIDLKSLKLPNLSTFPGGQGGFVASIAAASIAFAGTIWALTRDTGEYIDMQTAQTETQIQSPAQGEEISDPMPTATTDPGAADVDVIETPMAQTDVATVEPKNLDTQQIGEPIAPADAVATAAEKDPVLENPDDLGAFIQKQLGEDGTTDPQAPLKQTSDTTAAKKPAQETQVASVEPEAVQDTASSATGKIYGSEDANARLVLKAKGAVWVRVENAAGKVLMTQMLYEGDLYRVPDEKGLTVIAKDGGMLSFMIDGKDRGLLGTPGKILAGEALDISKLEAKG
jgi:cytoskeleton protein RodZ